MKYRVCVFYISPRIQKKGYYLQWNREKEEEEEEGEEDDVRRRLR